MAYLEISPSELYPAGGFNTRRPRNGAPQSQWDAFRPKPIRLPAPRLVETFVPDLSTEFSPHPYHPCVGFADYEPPLLLYRAPMVKQIVRIVADEFGFKVSELLCRRRTKSVVMPRHMAMYLAKDMTPKSFPELGRCFGGFDHTSVIHACRRIAAMMLEDDGFASRVNAIRGRIEAGCQRCL